MAHKEVTFRSDAREKLLKGATALSDAVRITLGPKSKSVPIERKWGKPLENAVSVAGILLLTEAVMTEIPEEKSPTDNHGAPGLE